MIVDFGLLICVVPTRLFIPPQVENSQSTFIPFPSTSAAESRALLDRAMATLPPRLRTVAEGIQSGKNYREIGESLGISKQAAHKRAGAAIASLRETLATMGYSSLDTLGLLKSASVSGCGVSPQAVTEASRLHHSPPQVDLTNPYPTSGASPPLSTPSSSANPDSAGGTPRKTPYSPYESHQNHAEAMPDQARAPSSSLRPSQATAAELVTGGSQIAIPAKQPLSPLKIHTTIFQP